MRALLLLLIVLLIPLPARAETRRDPDLGLSIAEGVGTRQFLWLRGSNGALVRFDRASGERTVLATDTIDILADGEALWVLSGRPEGYSFTLQDIRATEPAAMTVGTQGRPVALVKGDGDAPDLLATEGYMIRQNGRWRRADLAATLSPSAHVVRDASGAVYIGYNKGEWGGGLRRIDPETGTISFVMEPGEDICGGLINPACDPVVGLFRDQQRPDCLVVGVGLAHLSSSDGRIYQVCGTDIRETWTTPIREPEGSWPPIPQRWVLDDVVETPDGWIGLSTDRYFLNRNGEVTERPMPVFEAWSGLRIAEADGAVFIVAACCWGSETRILYRTLALPISE